MQASCLGLYCTGNKLALLFCLKGLTRAQKPDLFVGMVYCPLVLSYCSVVVYASSPAHVVGTTSTVACKHMAIPFAVSQGIQGKCKKTRHSE